MRHNYSEKVIDYFIHNRKVKGINAFEVFESCNGLPGFRWVSSNPSNPTRSTKLPPNSYGTGIYYRFSVMVKKYNVELL